MKNEEIAIELVKAWSMQPSTAQKCFVFDEIFENYKKALKHLNEEENKKIKKECEYCGGMGAIRRFGPEYGPGIVYTACEACDGKGYLEGKDE